MVGGVRGLPSNGQKSNKKQRCGFKVAFRQRSPQAKVLKLQAWGTFQSHRPAAHLGCPVVQHDLQNGLSKIQCCPLVNPEQIQSGVKAESDFAMSVELYPSATIHQYIEPSQALRSTTNYPDLMTQSPFFSHRPPLGDLSAGRVSLASVLRILALLATLSISAVYADDYADVNALVRAGKLAEALTKADQYLAGKPRDPQMRFIKGVIQTEAAKPLDAITTFTQITQDYPELPEPYNNLAVLHAGQGQFDKARAALEMAIRTNPSYATAHENLGDVYAKLASQAYSKALQLDGANAGVQPKLALIRTLFAPDAKGQKPTAAPQAAAKPVAIPAAAVAAAPPASAQKPVATPAATASPATPAAASAPAPVAAGGAEKEVAAAVRAWADAWSEKDVDTYLSSYGANFDTPGSQSRSAWEADRRTRIVGKSRISVKLSNLSVTVQGSKAVARFKQDYSANSLNVSSRKTLDLVKVGERWVIVKESTGS